MKKLILMLFTAVVFINASGLAQNISEIELLSQIDKKATVTYGEAVQLFIFQLGKSPSSFEQDSAVLISEGIALDGYTHESRLTKGMLAKMAATYLNLQGSLMYLIFSTERYAFKACIANGIFSEDGSASDNLSGPVMIEIFSKISEIKGGQK